MSITILLLLAAAAFAEPASVVKTAPVAPVPLVIPNLMQGSVFNRDFIAQEKNAPQTVVFDLDGTLGRMTAKGDGYVIRDKAVAQLDRIKDSGRRVVMWTAQPVNGLEVLSRSRPDLLPKFDLVIAGENFIPQSMIPYEDPEFEEAYRGADAKKVDAFYSMGVAKDLSLFFDGARPNRGYAVIVDDNQELADAAHAAPYGPINVYRIQPFLEGRDLEPLSQLAKTIRRMTRPQSVLKKPSR